MIDNKVKLLVDDLLGFLRKKYKFDRDPNISFKDDDKNAKRILGKTGYYDPDTEEIVIFCTNRHPKDILRSVAHEILHHVQKCQNIMNPEESASEWDENYILHNKKLKMLEGHAFLMGNLDLREWEALKKEAGEDPHQSDKNSDVLEEKSKKKKTKRKLSAAKLKKAKKMATSMEKKQGYSAEKAHKIAYAAVQKESINESQKQIGGIVQPEVIVNDALKDSVVYNKDDRACNTLYNGREELVYQELLKKFGIKK